MLNRYIVDFYFDPLRIAFEIDGRMFHEDKVEYDAARDVELAQNGISVIRIGAYSVLRDVHEVANFIRMICMQELSLHDLDPNTVTIAKPL